jgi:hypothetical protein
MRVENGAVLNERENWHKVMEIEIRVKKIG